MTITAVFVLFAITWFMILFLALQINIKTQGDVGDTVHGTHASSPVNFDLKKRLWITTFISVPLTAVFVFIIVYDVISLDMFEFMNFL